MKFQYTAHQACAYGSERPKWTVLAHNRVHFSKICKTRPGESSKHVHKAWGVIADGKSSHFATSEETAYPLPLAGAIAAAFAKSLIGITFHLQKFVLQREVNLRHPSYRQLCANINSCRCERPCRCTADNTSWHL